MSKRILALLLAGVMVLSTGCSANVSVDPDTGVVAIDGVPVNELMKDFGAGISDESVNEDEDINDTDDAAEEDADDERVVEYKGGIKIEYPQEFLDAKGMYSGISYPLDDDGGIMVTYFSYAGVTKDWLEEAFSVEEPSAEDQEKYSNSKAGFTYVFMIDGDRSLEDLVEYLNSLDNETVVEEGDFEELAKVEDCTFFRYRAQDKEYNEEMDKEFVEEFESLYGLFDDIFKNAEYFKPVDPYEDIIGKKIEFTTTDIDGNEITSEEIFSQNEITMVNVWATWCGWCVKELPELNEINERISKKDCAVVGIVGDGTDEDLIEEAKQLLKENGDEYLNILPWDGALTDDFPMDEGWPTTFFVDRDGQIAARPVVGANVDAYEKVIDQILEGKEVKTDDDEESPVTSNDVKQYRVYVSDSEGNLIEGVTVQLCDDATCRVENTDKNGLAVFKVKETEYTVHILKSPEGYKKNTQEYKMPDEYSDLHIILEKE